MGRFQWRTVLLFIILSNISILGWSTQSTNKFWSSFTLAGSNGSFLYQVEPQLRLIEADNPFNQFLLNVGGGYPLNATWQFWLGQTLGTTSQDADADDLEEYRIWEQLLWQGKIHLAQLESRTRIEQRKSFDFSTWANRVRERVLINIPLTRNISLIGSNEIFINFNQVEWITTKTWDQNRTYLGITQQLSPTIFLSTGYMRQWIFTAVTQSDQVFILNLRTHLKAL